MGHGMEEKEKYSTQRQVIWAITKFVKHQNRGNILQPMNNKTNNKLLDFFMLST